MKKTCNQKQLKIIRIIFSILVWCMFLGIGSPEIHAKAADINAFTDQMTLNEGDVLKAVTVSSNTTITLNGEIKQEGTVTINNGATLTINGTGTFLRSNGFKGIMFDVQTGGTLTITGAETEGGEIVIDGAASWSKTQVGDSTRWTASIADTSIKATEPAFYLRVGSTTSLSNMVIQKLGTQNGESKFGDVPAAAIDTERTTGTNYATLTMDNVDVNNCITFGGNSILLLDDCNATIRNSNFNNNYAGGTYSGVLKASGTTYCKLTMTSCGAKGNYSSGWGGFMLWAANVGESKATITGCTFEENTARYLGGAISNEATMELENCTIKNNIAMSGGGIATFPFTLTKSGDAGLEVCGLRLSTGNTISDNISKATSDFTPFSISDDNGTKTDGDDKTIGNQITYPAGGGGIWCYMNKGDWKCTLNVTEKNTITGNTAENMGGGVYVHQYAGKETTLSISGATISENIAVSGGGVALRNEDTVNPAILNISTGTISGNTAYVSGGGAYVDNGTCNISGEGSINNNTAQNGGGVYINQGTMNVTGGYIIANQANGSTQNTTAYESTENAGVGGGVYLNTGTFKMTAEGTVGLYGNLASFAADDVYANPSNTSWTIPKVENMNLSNFGQSVGTVTGWYEDYSSQDTKYSNGLNGGKYDDGSVNIMRYRSADNEHKIENTKTTMEDTYVCLTLGYELNKYPLKIKKDVTGAGGDTYKKFEFTIVVTRSDGTEYDLFADLDDNSFSLADNEEQSFLIPYGYTYTIVETDYTNEGYDTYINQSEEKSNTFTDEMDVTDEKTVSFENRYRSVNVTVTKKVTGNLGDQSKDFNFTCVVRDKNNSAYTTDIPASFTLKHGETRIITIPYGYSIEIVESDYSSEKYKTTVDGVKTNTYTGTNILTDTSVVYENNKQAEVDTGVDVAPNSTNLPMMLIIVCLTTAGILTLHLLKRRRFY